VTRTFLALELPPAVKSALRRRIDALSRQIPDARWVNPDGLHLTLVFLGELNDERLEAATEAAATVAGEHAPFTLKLAQLGTFGAPHAPRIIWVGVAGERARLLALQAAVSDALAARGFPREERLYSPHLTLARVSRRLPDAALEALTRAQSEPPANVSWRAEAISVMKSELARPAARYSALSRWPLSSP
jgi:RNA 2',3'-cyclic 3'-phosphodiesterase